MKNKKSYHTLFFKILFLCSYGFILGGIGTALILWSMKQFDTYPKDHVKYIFWMSMIFVIQRVYIKTYKYFLEDYEK